jgi:MOSC domain-containing protein YiiM
MTGQVVAVARSAGHGFSKQPTDCVILLAGLGVEGDAHLGVTVQHLSRIAADPTQPNLRQVHLIHQELFDELRAKGFHVSPGDLGENITTRGVALLDLPTGTLLTLGDGAVVEVTGLRNPCAQIEAFQTGLLAAVLDKGPEGQVIRKSGIMGIVRQGGTVRQGDGIGITLPGRPHLPLERV